MDMQLSRRPRIVAVAAVLVTIGILAAGCSRNSPEPKPAAGTSAMRT